jgi:hypothetical protein
MTQITTADELQSKLDANRYSFFTFPVLDITVKYRNPDLLKLSFNKTLPAAMADVIIGAYKALAGGESEESFAKRAKEKQITASEEYLQELSTKGYVLLSELVVSHRIADVQQSDTSNNLISWNDIPEEDAIAFVVNLVDKAQEIKTKGGGKTTSSEVETFPDGARSKKRSVAGKAR